MDDDLVPLHPDGVAAGGRRFSAPRTVQYPRLQNFYLFLGLTAFASVFYFSSVKPQTSLEMDPIVSADLAVSIDPFENEIDRHDISYIAAARPNIILVLTDDQDLIAASNMPHTAQLIAAAGATLVNSFVASPLCCPSRASILTGRYVHNHGAINNSLSGHCSDTQWQSGAERRTLAVHLSQAGYRTLFAGKYLNQYGDREVGGVKHVPPGWSHWVGLVGNSRYYNYTLSVNGKRVRHGFDPQLDYLPTVLSQTAMDFLDTVRPYNVDGEDVNFNPGSLFSVDNKQEDFNIHTGSSNADDKDINYHQGTHEKQEEISLKRDAITAFPGSSASSVGDKDIHLNTNQEDQLSNSDANNNREDPNKTEMLSDAPFFMMISTPSCHAPFTPEPKYSSNFSDKFVPRTDNFNIKNDASKHWLLRQGEQPLSKDIVDKIDDIYRNRLRTLLSVDDIVYKIINSLERKNLLDNTYIIFTSDNGYHLGQFSLPLDKREPYEFDTRVPFMVRGPDIPAGVIVPHPTINVDLAPTILDLAGITVPSYMDGISIKPLLLKNTLEEKNADESSYLALEENIEIDTNVQEMVDSRMEEISVITVRDELKYTIATNNQINKQLDLLNRRTMLIEHSGEGYPKQTSPDCEHLGSGLYGCSPEFDCKCSDSWNNTYACVRQLFLKADSDSSINVASEAELSTTSVPLQNKQSPNSEPLEGKQFSLNDEKIKSKQNNQNNGEIEDNSMSQNDRNVEKNVVFCKWKDNENFVEYYDLSSDQYQLHNKVNELSKEDKHYYVNLIEKLTRCSGSSCHGL